MRIGYGVVVASVVMMAGVLTLASADQMLNLYDGTTAMVELGSWGTGSIEHSDKAKYQGSKVIEVETKGYYEGGRLELKSPADFAAFGWDLNRTQVIAMVKAPEPQVTPSAGYGAYVPGGFPARPGQVPGMPGMGGAPGMPGMGGMPGMPGMGGAPGMPGMGGMPGMPGMGGAPGMPGGYGYQPPLEPIDQIRIVLVTDKGQLDSGPLALDPLLEEGDHWVRVARVLSDFKGVQELEEAKLLRVVLTGNREGSFYIGNLRIVQEDKPLTARVEGDRRRRVPLQQEATLTAAPQVEGVQASYIWDFDDLDGLTEDAYGQQVSCQFPEPGYYIITLTVTDKEGRREWRMDKVYVIVEE